MEILCDYPEQERQRQKAIDALEMLLEKLKTNQIKIRQCWFFRGYFDENGFNNWFSLEWEDPEAPA